MAIYRWIGLLSENLCSFIIAFMPSAKPITAITMGIPVNDRIAETMNSPFKPANI
jgi:hypothetical protein